MSTLTELPDVLPVQNYGYLVKSKSLSTDGTTAWRLVRDNTCDCPAGVFGARDCRHRKAVREYVAAEAAKRVPRPVGTLNPRFYD